jgi:hypothetical protein
MMKASKDFAFDKQLISMLEAHEKEKAHRQELMKKAEEANQKKLDEFKDFKSQVIKPLLEIVSAVLAEHGFDCKLSDLDDPPRIGLEIGRDNYIGFIYGPHETLSVHLRGQPISDTQTNRARFRWKDSRSSLTNKDAIQTAILSFVKEFLAQHPE